MLRSAHSTRPTKIVGLPNLNQSKDAQSESQVLPEICHTFLPVLGTPIRLGCCMSASEEKLPIPVDSKALTFVGRSE